MAVAAGWCAPIRIPKRKEPVSRLRWLTRKEWNKLYASLPPHLKAPALFALSTGLRQANVLALQWHQVDMKRRVMWVQAEAMKAKKAIGLPLSEDALSALRMAQSAKGYVFTYKGEPMKQIKTAFTKAKARAKVDCTWHDLRHTFASWHVQSGTPLAVVKELGGWSTMDMVMRYAHLAPDHLAEWANNVTKMAQPKRKAASPR